MRIAFTESIFSFALFIFLKRPFDLMKRPYGKTVI